MGKSAGGKNAQINKIINNEKDQTWKEMPAHRLVHSHLGVRRGGVWW